MEIALLVFKTKCYSVNILVDLFLHYVSIIKRFLIGRRFLAGNVLSTEISLIN